MPNIFDLDKKSLARLRKFQKAYPAVFQRSTASILNTQAFELRRSILKTLGNEFEIRNQGFVNRHVVVQKALTTQKIDEQVSWAGSTRGKRFSGWIEQELGIPTEQSSRSTAARGGNFSDQVEGQFRNNKILQFKRPRNFRKKSKKKGYNHKTYGQSVMAMLENAKNSGGKRFVIEKGGGPGKLSNFKGREGLYYGRDGGISNLHKFGEKWKPKRTRWMEKSISRLDRTFNLKNAWGKELEFRLKKLGAK
jgi:hypothetical protein